MFNRTGARGVAAILGAAMVWSSCQPHAPPEPHRPPESPAASITAPPESGRDSPGLDISGRPAGAWTLTFDDPYPACPIAGHTARIGQVSQDQRGPLAIDGLASRVRCILTGDKSVKIQAFASAPGRRLQLGFSSMSSQASENQPATGHLDYMTANLDVHYDGSCEFYSIPAWGARLERGMFWVAFKCVLHHVENDALKCAVHGHATFENCSTDRP
jgi:hypothetical protein